MSRLNRIAALVGLIAGGLGTLSIIRISVQCRVPSLVCLKADFPGDTCEFWVRTYGQDPCANCAMTLPDSVYTPSDIQFDEYLAKLEDQLLKASGLQDLAGPPSSLMLFDKIVSSPIIVDTRPEWIKRLSPAAYADWYRRRHHCSEAWIGMSPEPPVENCGPGATVEPPVE